MIVNACNYMDLEYEQAKTDIGSTVRKGKRTKNSI